MKQSNTGKSSFTHNDVMYECWYDGRYEMANDNYENIDIDTVKARQIFAKSVIDFLNDNFSLSLQYDGLYIPKFYNYESDKINFSFNDNDFSLLLNAIKDYELSDELANNIKQHTTSCSGYVAFYNEYEQYYDMQCVYDKLEDAVALEVE